MTSDCCDYKRHALWRPWININTLDRCKKYWWDRIRDGGYTVHNVIGNHDTFFKNTNRVTSPELIFGGREGNNWFYTEPTTITVDGTRICIIPWITMENYEQTIKHIKHTDATIAMGHLELSGFEMVRGARIDHGLSPKVFSKFDLVLSGHYHHRSAKDNIIYLGAPYEMTWSDYDDPRGFHIFDPATATLEHITNPHKLFHKVFYDDRPGGKQQERDPHQDFSRLTNAYVKVIVKGKDNPHTFDLFIDAINSYQPVNVQVVDDHHNLDIENDEALLSEAEDTKTMIKKYVDSMGLEDPKPVSRLMEELYHDALSME